MSQALHKNVKSIYQKKKEEKWDISHLSWVTIPGINRWRLLIPDLMLNVNRRNEYCVTLIQGCIKIMPQHAAR